MADISQLTTHVKWSILYLNKGYFHLLQQLGKSHNVQVCEFKGETNYKLHQKALKTESMKVDEFMNSS